ncbi:TPA: hypothetical protein ACGOVM_002046 [Streptococcus suis]
MYTSKQRQEISEKSYSSYQVGKPVQIGSKGEKVTIGYVASVEKTGSEFKAYVITDIKLPKDPTQEQLDKVSQVTMLYEGFTASFASPQKSLDTMLDWVGNDLPMATRVLCKIK